MSSSPLSPVHPDPRAGGQASFVLSLALVLLAAGALPAAGQQRIEITTKRVGRSEVSDSVRRLQRTLDSLSHVYTEDEQLNAAQRRRVEVEIGTTVERLDEILTRMNGTMFAPAASGVRIGPANTERAAQALSRELMQVREFEEAAPRGWIGFVAQGAGLEPRVEGGELIVRYFSYPRILSVDPSSPAQRAGIAPNDTLIAYNGRDVRDNEISLTRLLRPNARVRVRVLRDGRVLEIPVTVATAPSGIARRRSDASIARETWNVPDGPGFPRIAMAPTAPGSMSGTARVSIAAPQAGFAPSPPTRTGPTILFGISGNGAVAGAQLTTITRDLGEAIGQALGATSGVLVTNAPIGSPANESGLRDGDVIVKVGGQVVRTVSEVRELVELANNEGHTVDVDILRQKKPLRIALKW